MTAQNEKKSGEFQKVQKLVEGINIAMLTHTSESGEIFSCPMATQKSEFDGTLWFLTAENSEKVPLLRKHPEVNVAYSDTSDMRFVSVSGRAEVLKDKQKIEELWNPIYKAWFPNGKDDPNISVIKVTATSAHYWDAPNGKMVQLFGFLKAALTGEAFHGRNMQGQVDFQPHH